MDKTGIIPGKIAQYYALMSWNGMTAEEAERYILEHSYEETEQTAWAGSSLESARKGINQHLIQTEELSAESVMGDVAQAPSYYQNLSGVLISNFRTEAELCDAIIHILAEIHDTWVTGNAKKYNRDADKADRRLYQHLPAALIGLEEVSIDLMFLAPILQTMGYNVGHMQEQPWGHFIASENIAAAYHRYVESYKIDHGIESEEDLERHITEITAEYEPLDPERVEGPAREIAAARVEYMKDPARVKLLCEQVKAKNPEQFDTDDDDHTC